MDEKVKQPLHRRLKEIKFTYPEEFECKLLEIIKDPEEFGSYTGCPTITQQPIEIIQ